MPAMPAATQPEPAISHSEPEIASPLPESASQPPADAPLDSLLAITDLCEEKGEYILASFIRRHMRPVLVETGKIDVQLIAEADEKMLANLAKMLASWTGQQWLVSLKHEGGAPTIEEAAAQAQQALFDKAATDPMVGAVLETFPSAQITAVNENSDDENNADESRKG